MIIVYVIVYLLVVFCVCVLLGKWLKRLDRHYPQVSRDVDDSGIIEHVVIEGQGKASDL